MSGGGVAGLGGLPLIAELDGGEGHYEDEHHVEQDQLTAHSEGPFLTGTSFRATTPERLTRTDTVLFLSWPPLM